MYSDLAEPGEARLELLRVDETRAVRVEDLERVQDERGELGPRDQGDELVSRATVVTFWLLRHQIILMRRGRRTRRGRSSRVEYTWQHGSS